MRQTVPGSNERRFIASKLSCACRLSPLTFPATGARPQTLALHGAFARVRVDPGVSLRFSYAKRSHRSL